MSPTTEMGQAASDGSRVAPMPTVELPRATITVPPGATSPLHGAAVATAVAVGPGDDGPRPVAPSDEEKCCCPCCLKTTCNFMTVYIAVLVVFSILAALLGPAGLVLLALAPFVVIFSYAEKWHRRVVTKCSMFEVMGWATLILCVPLMVAISVLDANLPMREKCSSSRAIPFWRYFFMAYVRAGLLEELLKCAPASVPSRAAVERRRRYCSIRRLLFKPFVVDARSLLVYGAIAGATFGIIENLEYTLSGGIATGIVRSLLTARGGAAIRPPAFSPWRRRDSPVGRSRDESPPRRYRSTRRRASRSRRISSRTASTRRARRSSRPSPAAGPRCVST